MFIPSTSKLKKKNIIVLLFIGLFLLNSCKLDMLKIDSFENKEQAIVALKKNVDALEMFSKESYNKYEEFTIIESNFFGNIENVIAYKMELHNTVLKYLKVKYVVINKKYDRIEYHIKSKKGYDSGFYFSLSNNKNYEMLNDKKITEFTNRGSYFEFDNKTALINDDKHGWYTEKIFDNWYFFEQDYDYLEFIEYIYDDIVNMKQSSKYYLENKEIFEKYNPHKIDKSENDE